MAITQNYRTSDFVDLEDGTVSREVLVNPEIYRLELERILTRAWLFLGHESQIPNPGDYFVSRMGEESVIVSRDRDGRVYAFLNTCRHKGMKVCRYDEGNTRAFICPYHGWTYSSDGSLLAVPGELIGVPGFKKFYYERLDKKAWGLVNVAHLAIYKGTIWATWDNDAPPLLDYLGGMKVFLDSALDHRDGREGGSEVLGGVQKWRARCNWKTGAENFIGDKAHGAPTHQSVDAVGIGPSGGRGRRDNELRGELRLLVFGFPELGHGANASQPHVHEPPYEPTYQNHPEIQAYFEKVHAERSERLQGKVRVKTVVGTIFPNMSFHGLQPRTILVMHPNGPTETEFWRWYIVDADAPPEVKDALRRYCLRYSGPGGMTEQDDLENWTYATEAAKGTMARRYPYNYSMGIEHSVPYDPIPGSVWCNVDTSEQNQRIYYKRWGEFMDEKPWGNLAPSNG